MASLALLLKSHHRKTLLKISPNFTLSLHFSSSSDNNGENASKAPNFSFNLDEIKSRIKERDQHTQQHQNKQEQSMGPRPFRFAPQSPSNPPKATSFDEIKKNLSEYRRRSSAPTSASHSLVDSQQPILLQDIYKRNMAISTPNPNPNANPNQKFRNVDFNAIREGLRNLNASTAEKGKPGSQHLSLNKYRESFKPGPSMAESSRKVFGGSSEGLPISVFGKEMTEREKKKKGEDGKDEMAKSELIRMYSYDELGDKLRNLRPESTKKEKGRKEGWFSLTELNERLKKLREIEENQSTGVFGIPEMRTSLHQIGGDATIKKQEFRRYDILGQLGGTPSFMLSPPKEHLVEKYFHPDNMSSEEKLKLELKRMRDEFKMHESDCGSTRVQIAQLTTEISHLSSLLHKKDKHSRRGLIAKVQQRKKLMKYLRRTDWDSYSFVLSKLGLRDNPDYKN